MKRMVSARSLAVLVLVAAAPAQTPAPAITQLFGFPRDQTLANCPQGDFPQALIEGADGNFYGITTAGGTGLNAQRTVFKITPGGQLTVIYSFAEQSDGCLPNGAAPNNSYESGWSRGAACCRPCPGDGERPSRHALSR